MVWFVASMCYQHQEQALSGQERDGGPSTEQEGWQGVDINNGEYHAENLNRYSAVVRA